MSAPTPDPKAEALRDLLDRQEWQSWVDRDADRLLRLIAEHLPALNTLLEPDRHALCVPGFGEAARPVALPLMHGSLHIGCWRDGQPLTYAQTCSRCGEEFRQPVSHLEDLAMAVSTGVPDHLCEPREDAR